jgi:hypothetical protein
MMGMRRIRQKHLWMGSKCTKWRQYVRASQGMYGSRTLSALATLGSPLTLWRRRRR